MKEYKFLKLQKSTRKEKKYMAIFQNRKTGRDKAVHFGAAGMSDYTKHKDDNRKKLYDIRHIAREDWSNPLTSGYWSKWLLWNRPTIKESFEWIKKDLKRKGYL